MLTFYLNVNIVTVNIHLFHFILPWILWVRLMNYSYFSFKCRKNFDFCVFKVNGTARLKWQSWLTQISMFTINNVWLCMIARRRSNLLPYYKLFSLLGGLPCLWKNVLAWALKAFTEFIMWPKIIFCNHTDWRYSSILYHEYSKEYLTIVLFAQC